MRSFIQKIIFLLIILSIGNNLQAQTCAEIYKKSGSQSLVYFRRILKAATILSNSSELKQPDEIKNKAEEVIDHFYNKYLRKANTSFIREEIIAPLHKFNIEGNELGLCNKRLLNLIFDPRGAGSWKRIYNYRLPNNYYNYILMADLLSINDKNIFLIEEFMEIARTAQKIRKDKEQKYKDQTKENRNQETVTITLEEYRALLESSKNQILESTLCDERSHASGS